MCAWQELTGSTPQQWLRDLRLTEASQALAAGQPLETTALRCGYSTASALAYCLRRDRGVGSRSCANAAAHDALGAFGSPAQAFLDICPGPVAAP
ncbi:helix-turn-helix domain-containing protein [Comamonas sp. JC664]|uniref:helix-turn-helix domain-containing protein n=1 Tax=Comamonas sp. JC664 TaxID=2801917 RepID=UPI003617BA9B